MYNQPDSCGTGRRVAIQHPACIRILMSIRKLLTQKSCSVDYIYTPLQRSYHHVQSQRRKEVVYMAGPALHSIHCKQKRGQMLNENPIQRNKNQVE